MKKLIFTIQIVCMFLFNPGGSFAQSKITGDWEGLLDIGAKKIKLVIHLKGEGSEIKTLLDSPEQGVVNLPLSETRISSDSLIITDKKMGLAIKGRHLKETDSISASFIQRGAAINILFGRSKITGFILNRPQTPKPPFPYIIEEVKFENPSAGGIKLAGTLTIPKDVKNPPAVILISGSGAQNRNEKGFDHEPFLILSDYLSRNGIAVLRYDDRGVAESEGDFSTATSYDFSTDAEAAFNYLSKRNDINIKNIGLLGHSEGGMIAPMTASRNENVAFVISLAGPAVPIDLLMIKQIYDLASSENRNKEDINKTLEMNKEVFEVIKKEGDTETLQKMIREILVKYNFSNGDVNSHNAFVKRVTSPWFKYFICYNPAPALEKISCPFLAINGTLDKQVNADMNLGAMEKIFKRKNSQDFTLNYLQGLNHAFQEAKTGDVAEYRMIEQTMSNKALETIVKWIKERF